MYDRLRGSGRGPAYCHQGQDYVLTELGSALGLPDRGMRLHIHHEVGSGDGLCGSFHRAKEPITVTPAEIIYQRRIAVLEHAQRTGNVAETCRVFGISRTRYYSWKKRADAYGLAALMPKERRAPQMPQATPTHVVERLLTLAVLEPTIGCRQYADRLGDQGFSIAKSTVQKLLVTHGLGRKRERLARAAAIAAATTGLVTEAAREAEPFGFCLASGGPGELVCVDSFYVGNLKGVGKVYQLTAIDVFTRWAFVAIVYGPVTGTHTVRFVDQLLRNYRRQGITVRAVLSDNGPEYKANAFRAPTWWQRACVTSASRPVHPTTTPSASASTAPSWRSTGARPSIAVASPRSASSKPKPTPGSSPTIAGGATTVTTWPAARPTRSSTSTRGTEQHDHHQPRSPSVTSTLGPEALGNAIAPLDAWSKRWAKQIG